MKTAKKRKPKPFRAAIAVKAAARHVVGSPPATRVETADTRGKESKKEKHKPKLEELIREEFE